jgi:predicted permease
MAHVAVNFPPLPLDSPFRNNPTTSGAFNRAGVEPLDESLSSRSHGLFVAMFASAAALVLLGCVNVSGLMAVRGLDRRREIELRRALGAQAEHIAALIVAEAGLLSAAGTVLGLALTVPCLRIALSLLPPDLILLKIPAIDWRVAAFAIVATILCVAGISARPIRRGLRATGMSASAASRGTAPARSFGRFMVVSSQIAIGLALTLGGALLVGSLVRLHSEDVGIDPRDVFAVEVRIPASVADARPGGAEDVLTRVLQGVRSIPGVTVAGATDAPLLRNMVWDDGDWTRPAGALRTAFFLNVHGITSGFFDVVRPRVLAGRLPTPEELDAGRPVLIVSEAIAKAFWPTRPAVGESLEYTSSKGRRTQFAVVGVVADARFGGWDEDRYRQIYAPVTALRRGSGSPSVLMRADSSSPVLAEMRRFMSAEGADVRAIRAMPLTEMFAETVRPRRFQSWLFGSFAAAALAIVGVGVLGLMAMTAARRTREIGLRMALGASRGAVVRLFLREQLASLTAGVVAGSLIAAWAVKLVQSYLYGLTPYDARVWLVAVLLVAGTTMLGTLIPSMRASRVDPATVLRLD